MLIEFSVTNFKSIQATQTLSLAASPSPELKEQNTFAVPGNGMPRLLRSVAIYGPNASGKSNLLEALDFMKWFVVKSSKAGQEGEPIGIKPFLFDASSRNNPSEFEALFLQEGVRYQYGFTVNQTQVIREWLIAYPEGRPQRWFERDYDAPIGQTNWHFSSKFKGRKALLQESTRNNALFLSTAVQLNNDQLKPVYSWFSHNLQTIGMRDIPSAFSTSFCKNEAGRKRVLEMMTAADLSISDIKVETKKFDAKDLPTDMPDVVKDILRKDLDGKEINEVKFLHKVSGTEQRVALDADDESDGTRQLFAMAGPWLDVLDNGHILFVDELNSSMHPLMVRFLISLINNPKINRKNAQLIFSMHDTSVLDNELLRRDQIWFTEKDATNATKLYPLSDFAPRKGEALERGYLKGRYGALPYIGSMRI